MYNSLLTIFLYNFLDAKNVLFSYRLYRFIRQIGYHSNWSQSLWKIQICKLDQNTKFKGARMGPAGMTSNIQIFKTITIIAFCSSNWCIVHSSSIHYCLLNKEKTMSNRSEVCQFLFNALLLLGYKLSCTILFQMVLAGKRPEIIMEICSRAMSFWSYQVLAIKIIVFYPTKNPPPSPIEGWLIICRLALLA